MNRDDVLHINYRVFFSHKKKEIMLCAATWMNPEIILRESLRQTAKTLNQAKSVQTNLKQ